MTEQDLIRIFIAEDQEIIRIGLETILSQHSTFKVVGSAGNGEDAYRKCQTLLPDVVIMDLSMPVMDGIEATRLLREKTPDVKILIVTSHETDDQIFACFNAGADGYCLKTALKDDICNAVQTVARGGAWLDARIADRVLRCFREPIQQGKANDAKPNNFDLTPRESDVLLLLVEGCSNAQIGQKLFVSPETVKTHIRHIMEKLEVSDRTQAAVKALRHGLA